MTSGREEECLQYIQEHDRRSHMTASELIHQLPSGCHLGNVYENAPAGDKIVLRTLS